jgi:hypothetical protein
VAKFRDMGIIKSEDRAYSGRWVAKLVAHLLAKAALWVNPDIFQK